MKYEYKAIIDAGFVLQLDCPDLASGRNNSEFAELMAQRLVHYASLVGRDNVLAGADCGFGTFVGDARVNGEIAWAKLASMAEGARLASVELWRR